jgi:hypothetical protein
VRWTYDDLEGVKMHHMFFVHETGLKPQLSFECCDSKNNSLLCLGKINMGVTCRVLPWAQVDRKQFQGSFFNPCSKGENKKIKKQPWSTKGSKQQATVTFQPPAFLS